MNLLIDSARKALPHVFEPGDEIEYRFPNQALWYNGVFVGIFNDEWRVIRQDKLGVAMDPMILSHSAQIRPRTRK